MTQRQVVSSGAMWEPVVAYSRAVRVGSWVSVAGTTAAAEGGGAVGGDDIGAQAREALRRIVAALQQAGAGPEHLVCRQFGPHQGRTAASDGRPLGHEPAGGRSQRRVLRRHSQVAAEWLPSDAPACHQQMSFAVVSGDQIRSCHGRNVRSRE